MHAVFVLEEDSGEILESAIFRRNQRVEELLNVRITNVQFAGHNAVRDALRRSVNAASDDYDLALLNVEHAFGVARERMIVPIDQIPFVDLERPYWDQNMIRDLSIGDRIWFTSGDFSLSAKSVTMVMLFNHDLIMSLGLPLPYDYVRNGQWTLDRFHEYIRIAYRDLNNNNIVDDADQFGFVGGQPNQVFMGFLTGLGQNFTLRDENNFPVIGFDNAEFIDAFQRFFDIAVDSDYFRSRVGGFDFEVFENGRALFLGNFLHWANRFRTMESDFGIIPFPKLNEQQESYRVSVVGLPLVFTVPTTSTDLRRTGAVLEALNSDSHINVVPVYYENSVKGKTLNRDEDSWEMLDIIFANRVYEIGRYYYSAEIFDPITNLIVNGNRDIAAAIEANRGRAMNAIERSIAMFLEED